MDQLELGRALRDEGIAAVRGGAFKRWAAWWIHKKAGQPEKFTSDEMMADLEADEKAPRPESPNAVGAAFNSAARKGIITKVGYTQSVRPKAHARAIAQWRGNAYLGSRR